jgi:hypothetical protein
MAPSRTMTGETFVEEKPNPNPPSPTSPTNTDISGETVLGDAIIEIPDDDSSSSTTSNANSSAIEAPPEPRKRFHLFPRLFEQFLT